MALNGVTRAINKQCSPDGVKDFLSHRECVVSMKKPAQVCYHSMVKDLYRIRSAETSLLHPSICWYDHFTQFLLPLTYILIPHK